MIPYDIDPSLHATEPEPLKLDDGFSPPRSHGEAPEVTPDWKSVRREEALAEKSDF